MIMTTNNPTESKSNDQFSKSCTWKTCAQIPSSLFLFPCSGVFMSSSTFETEEILFLYCPIESKFILNFSIKFNKWSKFCLLSFCCRVKDYGNILDTVWARISSESAWRIYIGLIATICRCCPAILIFF